MKYRITIMVRPEDEPLSDYCAKSITVSGPDDYTADDALGFAQYMADVFMRAGFDVMEEVSIERQ